MQLDPHKYFKGGNWLKADDVKNNSSFTIELVEEVNVIRDNVPEETVIVRFKDVDAAFGLNKTNMMRLIELFGAETRRWIGKKIKLVHAQAANPKQGGRMQKVLRVA